MNLKKILIISTIILLLSLTAVSAADLKEVNATNSIDHDTHPISAMENTNVENLNATSSTGTFDDLQREINNAPTGTVLSLTKDYNGHNKGKIELNKDLTIDGQGHTIDCLGASDCIAFHSNSGIIHLKNLKIINGCNNNYNLGGSIQVECSAKYILENCIFNDNWADNSGGAIYNAAKNPLTIINCEFNNNQAHNNNGLGYGGAIYSTGDVYIQGSTFKSNEAQSQGGAIYSEKEIHIENNGNYNTTFANNFAGKQGGAIVAVTVIINNDKDYMKPTNTFFIENRADSGGSIYSTSSTVATNTEFIRNSAKIDGGAIYAKYNVYTTHCIFDSNNAKGAQIIRCFGGAIYAGENAKINNCTFKKNYAENKGGAIYAEEVTFTEGESLFDSNTARDYGGAIYTDKFTNDVHYKTFTNNKAQNEDGGAIYINKQNWITFSQCIFTNNQCGDEGGAIYLDSSKSHLTLKENIFSKNSAKDGQAVFSCGYYDSINNNFWAGKYPSSNNNELVEWKGWPSDNIHHSDSNPVIANLMYSSSSIKDHKAHIILLFKPIYSKYFFGKIYDLNKVSFDATPEMEITDKKVSASSVEVDVLPEIGNIYTITANIYGYTTSMILDASKISITAPEIKTIYDVPVEFKIHLDAEKKHIDGDKYLVANQKMIVTLDSTNYEVFSDENGDASLYFNNYTMYPGTYEILISLGNLSYKSALTIIPNITIVAPKISSYYGSGKEFKIHLDGDKRFTANQNVKVSFSYGNYDLKTDENGDASIYLDTSSLAAGNYVISINVLNIYAKSEYQLKTTIEGENIIRTYGDYTPFPVTLKNSNGEYLPNCALFQYAIDNSMFMYMNVHGNEGQALLGIGVLNPGYHGITVYNLETKELRYFEIDILPQLSSNLEKLDIEKYTSQILNANNENKIALSAVSKDMESVNQNLNASTELNQNLNAPVKHIGDENIITSALSIVLAICLIMCAGSGIYITKR